MEDKSGAYSRLPLFVFDGFTVLVGDKKGP